MSYPSSASGLLHSPALVTCVFAGFVSSGKRTRQNRTYPAGTRAVASMVGQFYIADASCYIANFRTL